MSSYQIEYTIPYEGTEIAYCYTLEEVKSWIKNNKPYGVCYDDLTILEVAREIDVYSLMKED